MSHSLESWARLDQTSTVEAENVELEIRYVHMYKLYVVVIITMLTIELIIWS